MERSFSSEFWSDPRIMNLEPHGKFLFSYLFTNNLSHMSGFYVIPEIFIMHETRLSQKELDKQWKSLADEGLAYRDKATQTVWVVSMLKRQCHDNPTPKNIAAVEAQLKRLHNSPLIPMYVEHYADWGITYRKRIPPSRSIDTVSDDAAAQSDRTLESRIYNLESNTLESRPNKDTTTKEDRSLKKERFSDDPQNLVNLWNEKAPKGLKRTQVLSPKLRDTIKAALKACPERVQWEEIIQKIALSDFLRDKQWVTLDWVVKCTRGEHIENYAKILNGNLDGDGRRVKDRHLQDGIDAANRIMKRWGVSPEQQQLTEGEHDEEVGSTNILCPTPEAGEGDGANSGRGEDGDLFRRPVGLPAGDGAERDHLGQEEYEPLSDGRGSADAY